MNSQIRNIPPLTRSAPIRRVIARCALFLVALTLHAQEPAALKFNLPPDLAVRTFSLFSEQSGRGLIADADLIRDVMTNALRGIYTVREVLDRALAGTGLVAKEDRKSGSFMIHREKPAQTDNGRR